MSYTAVLNEQGKREWGAIFPNGVPLTSPLCANITTDNGFERVYWMAWRTLDGHTFARLTAQLLTRHRGSIDELYVQLDRGGLPLRSSLVSRVTSDDDEEEAISEALDEYEQDDEAEGQDTEAY
jgi:hypothetical protein